MDRLLVVRLGSLGDLVHTLPAVAALRRAHPAATIDWLVEGRVHRQFLELVPAISNIIVLRDRTVGAWIEARRDLAARRYDVALDFQGLLKSAALARLSGASRVIGFDTAALRERIAAWFYSSQVETGAAGHVIQKNLRLAEALGAAIGAVEFPLAAVDSAAERALRAAGVRDIALINPGAAWPNKRWLADRFGQVARAIRARHGLVPVVLWGPGERGLADAIVAASGGEAVVAPETSVSDLVALSRAASLVVSGDTGPLHIAAAVGTPIVALFGPTNPARNGPWSSDDISIARYDACACHYQRRCHRASHWCLEEISVDEVMEAVSRRVRVKSTPALSPVEGAEAAPR